MSAIGTYEVLRRSNFDQCLKLAHNIRQETTGKWIVRQTQVTGRAEFIAAWNASVLKRVDFDYSGYVLGRYLDAQAAINQRVLFDEESEIGRTLAKAFTAAFVFDAVPPLPDLPADQLSSCCAEEYGEDAPAMVEAITAAHAFFARGLAEITPENLVVSSSGEIAASIRAASDTSGDRWYR
jgi:hypothetical protein